MSLFVYLGRMMDNVLQCMNKLRWTFLIGMLSFLPSVNAQLSSLENTTDYFIDSPDSEKYAVIMTGPTVGEINQSQFRQWTFSLHDILARDYGYTSETIILLYADEAVSYTHLTLPTIYSV